MKLTWTVLQGQSFNKKGTYKYYVRDWFGQFNIQTPAVGAPHPANKYVLKFVDWYRIKTTGGSFCVPVGDGYESLAEAKKAAAEYYTQQLMRHKPLGSVFAARRRTDGY